MSRFFEDLEAQLHAAAVARVRGRSAGHRQFPRFRRGLKLAPRLAAAIVPLAVAAIVLTTLGAGGTRHGGAAAGHGGVPRSRAVLPPLAAYYINKAVRSTIAHDPACRPRGGLLNAPRGVSEGRPSPSLLSILGVLRRPAIAGKPPRSVTGGFLPGQVYRHYIRLARVQDGVSYYVIVTHLPAAPSPPPRCAAKEQIALKRALPPTIPRRERALILHLEVARGQIRRLAPTGPYDGVFLLGRGGTGFSTARQLRHSGLILVNGTTISGLVPDGVAAVELPLRPLRGYPHKRLTASVVNNVFVAHAPRFDLPTGEVWLSRTGGVIKRVDMNSWQRPHERGGRD